MNKTRPPIPHVPSPASSPESSGRGTERQLFSSRAAERSRQA